MTSCGHKKKMIVISDGMFLSGMFYFYNTSNIKKNIAREYMGRSTKDTRKKTDKEEKEKRCLEKIKNWQGKSAFFTGITKENVMDRLIYLLAQKEKKLKDQDGMDDVYGKAAFCTNAGLMSFEQFECFESSAYEPAFNRWAIESKGMLIREPASMEEHRPGWQPDYSPDNIFERAVEKEANKRIVKTAIDEILEEDSRGVGKTALAVNALDPIDTIRQLTTKEWQDKITAAVVYARDQMEEKVEDGVTYIVAKRIEEEMRDKEKEKIDSPPKKYKECPPTQPLLEPDEWVFDRDDDE